MPRKISFEELEKNKKYTFNSELSVYSGGNCIIRSPSDIGKIIPGKKIKVTIEVLNDDS